MSAAIVIISALRFKIKKLLINIGKYSHQCTHWNIFILPSSRIYKFAAFCVLVLSSST